MKFIKTLTLTLAGFLVAGTLAAAPASAAVSFDFFYSNLSPHGAWHVSANYGRVWQPAISTSGWNPYYDGHWQYSDVGWAWVSDYDWGPIAYHYGTWVQDDYYGWVWVPGYTWAPSWVVFREGPDYIGWAPVAPNFSVGVSFGVEAYPVDRFVFVPCAEFLAPRIRVYAVPPLRARVIVNHTTVIKNNITVVNNIVVNKGPRVTTVERFTKKRIDVVPIERVKQVTSIPGARFSKDMIRVDSRAEGRGLRAAEPVAATTPLPNENKVARRNDQAPAAQVNHQDKQARAAQDDRRSANVEPTPRQDGGNSQVGTNGRERKGREKIRPHERRSDRSTADRQEARQDAITSDPRAGRQDRAEPDQQQGDRDRAIASTSAAPDRSVEKRSDARESAQRGPGRDRNSMKHREGVRPVSQPRSDNEQRREKKKKDRS